MAGIDNRKGTRYGPAKLDNRLSQKEQVILETINNWRVELTAGGKGVGEGKIQRGYLLGKWDIAIRFCNSNDAP